MTTSVPSNPSTRHEAAADALADRFVTALTARDFTALEACFAPDVRFRALTPNHVWANFGAAGTVAAFRNWFEDATPFALVTTSVDHIGDRLSLTYRFRAAEDASSPLALVEQHLYAIVRNDRLADVSVVCSGYQPLAGDGT